MDVAYFLAMLRSALAVLDEAAGQARDHGVLDPFHASEVPLARQDAKDAMAALERLAVGQSDGERAAA